MPKIVDFSVYADEKFNRLTVLEVFEYANRDRKCRVQCECGKIFITSIYKVTTGSTKSCSCKKPPRRENLLGKQFGRWVVIDVSNIRKGSAAMWLCRCACGTMRIIRAGELKRGTTTSCGCYQKELTANTFAKDLTGMLFDRLLVISSTKERGPSGSIKWKCLCTCGNVTTVTSNSLLTGATKSCGCLQRERSTTHGLTGTQEYKTFLHRQRRDREYAYDTNWTSCMELALNVYSDKCAICDMSKEEHLIKYGKRLCVDHVRPLSLGHGLRLGNAALLCVKCNAVKHNTDINNLPVEWQASLIWHSFAFKDFWEYEYKREV